MKWITDKQTRHTKNEATKENIERVGLGMMINSVTEKSKQAYLFLFVCLNKLRTPTNKKEAKELRESNSVDVDSILRPGA